MTNIFFIDEIVSTRKNFLSKFFSNEQYLQALKFLLYQKHEIQEHVHFFCTRLCLFTI